MSVLYLLIPIALVILVIAIKLLFWAINNGQYDDLDMEGHRILFDDDDVQLSKHKLSKSQPSKNKSTEPKTPQDKAPKDMLPEYTKNITSVNEKPEVINEANEK